MSRTIPAAQALAALQAQADPSRAAALAAHHKVPRIYLGLPIPAIEALVAEWRAGTDPEGRISLAAALWDSDQHEARVAAAKLLTQARLGDADPAVWDEFLRWLPDFDAHALADLACKAGERRLTADPTRLDIVETWITDPNLWIRRAALVVTLPFAKRPHPSPEDQAARDRVLGWAETLVPDPNWSIQMAIGGWLRALSIHDPARTRAFLDGPGLALKPYARAEAALRLMGPKPGNNPLK